MPLIKCSVCQKEISDQASACPNCGHPVKEKIQIIELTSKRWKKVKLISWPVFISGLFMLMGGMQNDGFQNPITGLGFSMAFFAFIGILVGKFGAWWTNK